MKLKFNTESVAHSRREAMSKTNYADTLGYFIEFSSNRVAMGFNVWWFLYREV